MPILSHDAVREYEEQVASYLRRAKNKAEGEAALGQNSSTLLSCISDLLPTMQASPAYAGLAFYGRFQATNLKLIKRLAAESVVAKLALERIREGKALRVSAIAKPGWDFLLGADPEALWSAIRLNLCRSAVAEPVADDEELSEEQEQDDQEDEDDDN